MAYVETNKYTTSKYLNVESSLSFDGSSQYIDFEDLPEFNFNNDSDFSMSLIVKVQNEFGTSDSNVLRTLASKIENTGIDYRGWYLGSRRVSGINGFQFGIYNNSNIEQITLNTFNRELKINTDYHLVVTYNSNSDTTKLYLNSFKVDESNIELNAFSTLATLKLGLGAGLNYLHHEGQLSFLTLYNKELSNSEISGMTNAVGFVAESSQENIILSNSLNFDSFNILPAPGNEVVTTGSRTHYNWKKYLFTERFQNSLAGFTFNLSSVVTTNTTADFLEVILNVGQGTRRLAQYDASRITGAYQRYDDIPYDKLRVDVTYEYISRNNSANTTLTFTLVANTGGTIQLDFGSTSDIGQGIKTTTLIFDKGTSNNIIDFELGSNNSLATSDSTFRIYSINFAPVPNRVLEQNTYGEMVNFPSNIVESTTSDTSKNFYNSLLNSNKLGVDMQATGKPVHMELETQSNVNSFIPDGGSLSVFIDIIFKSVSGIQAIFHPNNSQNTSRSRIITLLNKELCIGYNEVPTGFFVENDDRIRILLSYNTSGSFTFYFQRNFGEIKEFSGTSNSWTYFADNRLRIGKSINDNNGIRGILIEYALYNTNINQTLSLDAFSGDFSTALSYVSNINTEIGTNLIEDLKGNVNWRFSTIGFSNGGLQYTKIGEGLSLEVNSYLPSIKQALIHKSSTAGAVSDQYFDLDTSNLPNDSEDYTFIYSGIINTISLGNRCNIFSLRTTDTATSGDRLEVNFNLTNNTLEFISRNSTFNSVVKDTILNSICTIAITRRSGVVKYIVNGLIIHETTDGDIVDFSSHQSLRLGTFVLSDPNRRSDLTTISFGYWKRALSQFELLELTGQGKPNNPKNILNGDNYFKMKENGIVWHQFQQGSFIDNGGTLEVINWLDGTGNTNGIVNGFTDLNDIESNLLDI